MDRTERFHLIDQMLSNQRSVSRRQFLETLEVSAATFKRDLEYMRDRLAAPIIWDLHLRGYRYQQNDTGENTFQLPGLWFNTSEIQALLTMHAWLENLQPGILSTHIKPLQSRIWALLDHTDHSIDEITSRIRILSQPRKSHHPQYFELLSQALLNRKRIKIRHLNRQLNRFTERDISPQRLTFYRDNWYLDSWCHLRSAIRSFAVDAIDRVELLSDHAREIGDELLDRELSSGYGIFSGEKTRMAELRFKPERARWVAQEQWHPEQKTRQDAQGNYYLQIPYSQEPELLMDILKYGADVEVLKPAELRRKVKKICGEMRDLYQSVSVSPPFSQK